MINGLIHNHCFSDAKVIFEDLKNNNLISINIIIYSSMVKGYFKNNEVNNAFLLIDEMKNNNLSFNTFTYNIIFDGLLKHNLFEKAKSFYYEMKSNNIKPDIITYSSLLNGFMKYGNLDFAKELIRDASYSRLSSPYLEACRKKLLRKDKNKISN